jgi:hypothetical protein
LCWRRRFHAMYRASINLSVVGRFEGGLNTDLSFTPCLRLSCFKRDPSSKCELQLSCQSWICPGFLCLGFLLPHTRPIAKVRTCSQMLGPLTERL